jgi:hypothetical protein
VLKGKTMAKRKRRKKKKEAPAQKAQVLSPDGTRFIEVDISDAEQEEKVIHLDIEATEQEEKAIHIVVEPPEKEPKSDQDSKR